MFFNDRIQGFNPRSRTFAPLIREYQTFGRAVKADPSALRQMFQRSVDLVNNEPALNDSRIRKNREPGEDKIQGLYPKVDWTVQLDYAAQIGLGSRQYELTKI